MNIAIDLDGTLAYYDGYKGPTHIGKPIKNMIERVKKLIDDGNTIKIFTARANDKESIPAIKKWCLEYLGKELDVTNVKEKDFAMFIDDRAVAVEKNTGKLLSPLLNEDLVQTRTPIQDFLDDLIP